MNVYAGADKAIKAMNRENLKAFDRLKMTKDEGTKLVRAIHDVYAASKKRARRRYYEIGFEAYLIGLSLCGIDPKKAARMAEDAIDEEWVDLLLSETDFVTLYRFDTEAERKEDRLAEALWIDGVDRDAEIDKALRYWSQQVGQYCLNAVDRALLDAYEDAGVEKAMWNAEHDEKTCDVCAERDGQVFRLDEVPRKSHLGCRCYLTCVID